MAATGRPGGRSTKEGEDRGRGRVRSSPRQLYGRRRREGRGVDLSLGFCRRLRVTAHLLCSIRLCHFCFDLVGSVFVQSVSQSYFSHPPTRRRRRFLCQSNHLCMLQLPQTRWWVSGGESSGYNSTRVQSSSSLFASEDDTWEPLAVILADTPSTVRLYARTVQDRARREELLAYLRLVDKS